MNVGGDGGRKRPWDQLSQSSKLSKWWRIIVPPILTVAILVLIFRKIPFEAFVDALANADYPGYLVRKLERELTAAKGCVTVDEARWPPQPRVDHQADIKARMDAAREKAEALSERLRRRLGGGRRVEPMG